MLFEVLCSCILLVRPRKLIARCAILSHEPKITKATLVSSPPRSPPSEGFHLATTFLDSLRGKGLEPSYNVPSMKKAIPKLTQAKICADWC